MKIRDLNPSTGLWNGGVSREGYKRIRNKFKSQESGQIHFQISSEEQRLDVCGMKKKSAAGTRILFMEGNMFV